MQIGICAGNYNLNPWVGFCIENFIRINSVLYVSCKLSLLRAFGACGMAGESGRSAAFRTGWSEWYAQMSGRDRFVRHSRRPGTKGHGAGAAAMQHAAGDGERDFCEREVTAAISADRKGSKGRMRTPKGGASGGLWRGYGGGRPALPERTFRTDTRWPGGIRDRP